MTKVLLIKWETQPNKDCMTFHCNRRLPEVNTDRGIRTDGTIDAGRVLELISAIPGIDHFRAYNYQIHLVKGQVFDWQAIKTAVEFAMLSITQTDRVCNVT